MPPIEIEIKTSAQILYDERFKETMARISSLVTLLDKHRDAQLESPIYWHRASDLGRLNADLDKILRYMK